MSDTELLKIEANIEFVIAINKSKIESESELMELIKQVSDSSIQAMIEDHIEYPFKFSKINSKKDLPEFWEGTEIPYSLYNRETRRINEFLGYINIDQLPKIKMSINSNYDIYK